MLGGGVLSKNVGDHGWPPTKNFKYKLTKIPLNSCKKEDLDLKINNQNLIFVSYLLIPDFLVEILKSNKKQ